jgi:subtilisin-like proprotein convertase family protein
MVGALALPAAAHAASIGGTNNSGITINDNAPPFNGLASPYPSTINLSGGDGPILDVNVSVTLTHNNINDVDLALVGPSGAATILMSDACGTGTLSSRTFTFNQGAPSLSSGGPCAAGSYSPTDYAPADNFPAPGPGALTTTNLNTFDGLSADGQWSLYAVDDSSFQAGAISSWSLNVSTATALIVIPNQGLASPYPSEKTFDTPNGQVIDDLNLTVNGFNHSFPRDVDMMLEGPTGETVMVMSDACGTTDIADNRVWTFDDEAAVQLGGDDEANCTAGSRRTADYDPDDTMPAPAPPRPYGADLSVFDGLPGGNYRLFVNDDAPSDTGYIADWAIQSTTRPPAATGFAATAVPAAEGQTAQLTVSRTGSANLGAASVNVAITDGDTDNRDFSHALPTKIDFARGEASKTIDIPINADQDGEPAEKFFVQLADATGDAKLADATSIATVTIAKSEPDNNFKVGKAQRKPNGSAVIPVTVPGPGQLTSDDAGAKNQLKTIDGFANSAGTTALKVKPAKSTKRKLKRGKKVKLTAEITFTPTDGKANSAQAPVSLKRKP